MNIFIASHLLIFFLFCFLSRQVLTMNGPFPNCELQFGESTKEMENSTYLFTVILKKQSHLRLIFNFLSVFVTQKIVFHCKVSPAFQCLFINNCFSLEWAKTKSSFHSMVINLLDMVPIIPFNGQFSLFSLFFKSL